MSDVTSIKNKSISVMLDTERHLKFDLNAFACLEELYGSIPEALQALEKGSIKAVRALLWAGLLHEDENLTERQVGSFVGMENLQSISESINAALMNSLPTNEQKQTIESNGGN